MDRKLSLEELRAANSYVLSEYKNAMLVRRQVQHSPKSPLRSFQLAQAKRDEHKLKEKLQAVQELVRRIKGDDL